MGEIAIRLQTEVEDALATSGRGKARIKQPLGPTMLAVIAAVARLESVVSELEIRLDHHDHAARPRSTHR